MNTALPVAGPVDPFEPHSAVCNRRTGFTPTDDEQHYVMVGLSPAHIVKTLHGGADAEWQSKRVEMLAAWREVWREGSGAYGPTPPAVEG